MDKRIYFWTATVLSVVVIAVIFYRSEDRQESFLAPELKNLKADLVLYGIRYRRDTRDEQAQWIVVSDLARFFEKKREVEFENVNVTFRPDSDRPMLVRARKGLYSFSTGVVSVDGNVTVTGFED
jgi:lipopolysaccharide export system protein LptC